MVNEIRSRLEDAIREHVFPGAVVGVISESGKSIIPVGSYTYEKTEPMKDDSIFDVASLTKVVPTSLIALHLIETQKLLLDTAVKTILPEVDFKTDTDIMIWHLLTATLPFTTSLASMKDTEPDDILRAILTTTFTQPVGTHSIFTNATSILLGLVIERVTKTSLADYADTFLFSPLSMQDTTFFPEKFPASRVVPTEVDPWRERTVQGEVHDESAFVLGKKHYVGSAGLFSTVPDLLQIIHMILEGGMLNEKTYFTQETVDQMFQNQTTKPGRSIGLGWELTPQLYMGTNVSTKTIGKTGFTGCVMMIDQSKKRGLIFLSNYHFPKRKHTAAALNEVRRALADIVFS